MHKFQKSGSNQKNSNLAAVVSELNTITIYKRKLKLENKQNWSKRKIENEKSSGAKEALSTKTYLKPTYLHPIHIMGESY